MKLLRMLSLGAGVQSTTLALMAARGEFSDVLDGAIFADTQDEPEAVYKHLSWLATDGVLPFPVHLVTAGKLSDLVAAERPNGAYLRVDIPAYAKAKSGKIGIINRSCTRDFKILPIIRKIRVMVGRSALVTWRRAYASERRAYAVYEHAMRAYRKAKKAKLPLPPMPAFPQAEWDRMQSGALVEQWIGISLDEASRMKPSRDPWIRCRWPLIERRMRRSNCYEWLQGHGYPRPAKSACIYCPFHADDQWQTLTPTEFARAVEVDRRLRSRPPEAYRAKGVLYLHRSGRPLDQIDFSTLEDRGQINMFENECEGMCGV